MDEKFAEEYDLCGEEVYNFEFSKLENIDSLEADNSKNL